MHITARQSGIQKDLAKFLRLILSELAEKIIRQIKPTIGRAKRSEYPKYAHGLSG
jgi:hypothetical protein